jgi:hypothetical protein
MPATLAALLKYPSTIFKKDGSEAGLCPSENLKTVLAILDTNIVNN